MNDWEHLRSWLLSCSAIDESVTEPSQVKRLDLSGRDLESLPDSVGMLQDMIALNLSNNRLSILPKSLSTLQHLGNLDIRRNAFVSLPAWLADIPLRSLNAASNTLTDVSVLHMCRELRVLDLSGNAIETLQGCLHPENEIRTLNLSENYIKQLDTCFAGMRYVERLNLSGNMLTHIPVQIGMLESVEMLDLSDNRIATLDETFFSLDAESVNLASNRLETVRLHGLENLEELTLDDNPFESITIEEGFAPYLRRFSCDGCSLTQFLLPESEQLEYLCYASNQIVRLPGEISRYTRLNELDLEGNRIVDLPVELENLTRLQTLYLGGNPLNNASRHIVEILHPDICDITMKTGITIEAATREDLPQMAQLLSALFAIEADFGIDYDKQLSGITKLFAHEGTNLLVARHDAKVVGMLTMQRLISSAEGDFIGQIEDLVVEESYRKMGVASRLINKMRFLAQEYGYKRIQLVADLDNDNAHRFYSRRGFRRTNLAVYHFLNK